MLKEVVNKALYSGMLDMFGQVLKATAGVESLPPPPPPPPPPPQPVVDPNTYAEQLAQWQTDTLASWLADIEWSC